MTTLPLSEQPQYCRNAVIEATSHLDPVPDEWPTRLERYSASTIRSMVAEEWKWSCSLASLDSIDRQRVQVIIDKLSAGEPLWPYVSYWSDTFEELRQTEPEEDGTVSVPNHGDGWHRLIAAFEMGIETVEIIFIERKSCDF